MFPISFHNAERVEPTRLMTSMGFTSKRRETVLQALGRSMRLSPDDLEKMPDRMVELIEQINVKLGADGPGRKLGDRMITYVSLDERLAATKTKPKR
jgi:hypothetical protein